MVYSLESAAGADVSAVGSTGAGLAAAFLARGFLVFAAGSRRLI